LILFNVQKNRIWPWVKANSWTYTWINAGVWAKDNAWARTKAFARAKAWSRIWNRIT
jgi:hypothetical protein